MAFKNILILSDNPFLCSGFNKILEKYGFIEHNFEFAISPFSNNQDFDVKTKMIDLKNKNDIKLILDKYDLIISVHCKQFFPKEVVGNVRCINVHPGYNPINRGWFPQVFSIIHDLPIGATIHEIDEKLDHGPIIARSLVEKYDYDTSETLYDRVIISELELIDEYLPLILKNQYSVTIPENEGQLFLKKDFNNLLEIDLEKNYTAGEFIKKLRALTHGGHKNAYYFDKKSGKKVFISVKITVDE